MQRLSQIYLLIYGKAKRPRIKTCACLMVRKVTWYDSLLPEAPLSGQGQLKGLVDFFRGAMPDLSLTLQRPLHVGEQGVVLGYWKASGTHTGPLGPSLPPSGANISWEGSVVIRTQPALAAPSQPGGEEQAVGPTPGVEDGAAATGAVEGQLLGRTVWWSWDPIFLFRELGWKGQILAADDSETPAVAVAPPAPPAEGDLAMRTAKEARDAFATEAEAAEAAAAVVAAAGVAAERLAESPEALAAVQAANRAVVEMYFHTYNTGHYAVLDHIVHPEYQYDGLLDLGGRRGREAMAAMMGGWRDCIPDMAIGHELFVAVGNDKVTFRWVIRGTHATPDSKLLGVTANGAPLLVRGVTTLTLRGGRIARKVSHANAAYTLQQLGAAIHPVIPLPAGAGKEEVKQPE
ncbi:hypothetical protein Vafri_6305 [Volvox africanus]|uniref:SnoaL-like domain-containing protein n=1 Tax=Volvox africanus TaxID=51714 RepID=A0A8J4AYC3_9CHLO|nr:hypothetical protein Vafri_6305 [Volvox africanus]